MTTILENGSAFAKAEFQKRFLQFEQVQTARSSQSELLYSVLRVHENVASQEKREGCKRKLESTAGADDDEDPPVPMPNTEVKLVCAKDTWMATSWENR